MPDTISNASLTAKATCGKYLKLDFGTITMAGGELSFEAAGRRVFDIPLSAIEKIVWHWYSFSGAFEFTTAGQNYFISFMTGEYFASLSRGITWHAALDRALDRRPPNRLLQISLRIAEVLVLFCVMMFLGRFRETFDSLLGFMAVLAGMVLAGLGILALLAQTIVDIILARRQSLFGIH